MAYEYSDPEREKEPTALPDLEVWFDNAIPCLACANGFPLEETACPTCGRHREKGFYYAFGLPGCLWDSEPVGPFETYEEALTAAREDS